MEGWISTEMEGPDWTGNLSGWDLLGDTIYLAAVTTDGGLAVAAYDTLSSQWQQTDLDTGEQGCHKLDFWQEEKTDYLMAMVGLDGEQILLGNGEKRLSPGLKCPAGGAAPFHSLRHGHALSLHRGSALYLHARRQRASGPGDSPDRHARPPGPGADKKDHDLAAFRKAGNSEDCVTWTSCPELIMDAAICFNNTDPEKRVGLDTRVCTGEAERNRLMMDLVHNSGADLIDTSRLPSGAVNTQLLADLLPYIDTDKTLSKEDFLPYVFDSLLKEGGVCEYTDKVTMLSLAVPQSMFDGQDWTAEEMENLIAPIPRLRLPLRESESYWGTGALNVFAMAAPAEFMDWENMNCHFENPVFVLWLERLDWFPEQAEQSKEPYMLTLTHDLCGDTGYGLRRDVEEEYVLPCFPGSQDTGSYFLRLGADQYASGENASLGILTSGPNRNRARHFLRTFMEGEEEPCIRDGIPLHAGAFERAMANQVARGWDPDLNYPDSTGADAKTLRDFVENSRGMVNVSEAVLTVLTTIAQALLEGQSTAGEAAAQIQNRLNLYIAERS